MKIYLVGGAVRDKLLGLPVKERDWVVVGATTSDMLGLGFRQVGKEFPVFLHPKTREEYALARMERKVELGYKGFTFDTSKNVKLEEDLKRRDLTINAMAETETGELIDPYHGKRDLEDKILRHVSLSFIEDPVRILRVARLLARYAHLGFVVAKETLALMQKMVALGEVNALVAERVWKELQRALGEKNPEKFFEVLALCHALPILFPHLAIDGPGIKALMIAATLTSDCSIRFATLFYAQPEDNGSSHVNERKAIITALCHRYRTPNDYRELAILTACHYKEALAAPTLSAQALLHLFYTLDIFRRPHRFKKFLSACHAIARALQHDFNPEWLAAGAHAAKAYDVKILITQGLNGNELALALKRKRQEEIAQWLAGA